MPNRPTIAYQPALDGVRAFAVVAVLLFHAGVPGFTGGYLGVSVFFTLSGYLITSLLLHEHDGSGTIDLPAFYARRLRRLLPASLVCLLGVAALAVATDLFDGVADLRAHFLGSLFQVANWVFLVGDGSYQALLSQAAGSASPLEHFWSLAIEEQFYWIWPPLMLLVLTRVRRRRDRVVLIGALAGLTSISAPVIAQVWGPDAAYWATPARIGEIIVGAFLAVVLAGRKVSHRVAPLAPAAFAVLVACIVLFPSSGGPAYEGALALIGVVSAALVLGLQAPGPLRPLLEMPGLVWVGKVSYGLYLFHWPIFVLVNPDRFDWSAPVLFVVRIGLTAAVTVASYELIEQPIRHRRGIGPRVTFVGAATATAVAVAVATVIPTGIGEYWNPDADVAAAAAIDVTDEPIGGLLAAVTSTIATSSPTTAPTASTPTDPAHRGTERPATTPSVTPTSVPPTSVAPTSVTPTTVMPTTVAPTTATPAPTTQTPLPPLARPVRIVVTGDSTAEAFGTGLVNWAAENPELAQVDVVAAPGCGFLVGGERRTGDTIAPIEGCDEWVESFVYPAVERLQADIVVAMVTSWDVVDRRWAGEELITPFDTEYADRLDDDYRALAAGLVDRGAGAVAFVRHPILDPFWLPAVDDQEDPARHQVIYDLYEELAVEDERVDVIDLDRWLIELGLDRSEEFRPDGIHPTPEAATRVSEQFLGDRIIRIALGAPPS